MWPFAEYTISAILSTRDKMKLLSLFFIFLATMVYGSFGFILLPPILLPVPILKGVDVTLDVGSRDIFEPVRQLG